MKTVASRGRRTPRLRSCAEVRGLRLSSLTSDSVEDQRGRVTEDTLVVLRAGPTFRTIGPITRDAGHRIPRPDRGADVHDGAWASWRWDGRELTVRTCPHGLISVYYALVPGGIAVSFSIAELLEAGADNALDWAALSVAIRIGFFIGDRTPFQNIRVVPPDAELKWCGGDLSLSASRSRDVPPRSQAMTLDSAVDGYLDLTSVAVRRRLSSGPFAMPLSGGRDSRHILCELMMQGQRPAKVITSQHYLDCSDADVETARAVAARLGLPHEIVTIPPYSLRRQARVCAKIDYGAFAHVWALTLAERLAEYDIRYDGLDPGSIFGRAGDAARRRSLALAGRWDELVEMLLGARDNWIDRLLAAEVRSKLSLTVATETVRAELDRFKCWQNPWRGFVYWNRVRRDSALCSFKVMRNPIVYCPFDDIDFVDFALSLPSEYCVDGELQKAAIRKRFPDLADIPFSDDVPRRWRSWFARRRDNIARSRLTIEMLLTLATRPVGLVNSKYLASIAAKGRLLRGRQFATVPPLAIYLLTLDQARLRQRGTAAIGS